MTDVKTVQREIRASVNLQATISALNKGKRGIGDYSFLTLELFKDILEKIATDKDQIFQIPNKEETIQKFWNEFLSLSKENEFELTSKLLAGLEPQTYIHAFSFVSNEIMLLCMMKTAFENQNRFAELIYSNDSDSLRQFRLQQEVTGNLRPLNKRNTTVSSLIVSTLKD